MKETFQGIGSIILWICLIYGAYKLLDVTGLGDLIGKFFDWFDTSPKNYCGVCDPPDTYG